ncbi:unnamed protein product [Acanthoscelides obtectus]|uniref:Nuclease HARBI1 n=1 Tax=Acanthoscelides obtectus TaxID=200917 RepID=A0A9P0P2M6_ACAOB|nr:unnamed protein product [Acanthoscelides obtectus]CAK1639103.1 hypothetical protein AOBTE_LOCUS10996 [Acanthoscelides obtectus]
MKIERQDTFMRDAIRARVKLEVTLCFLSSGISYRLLAIFFRISKFSISKFIPEVCDVMYEALDEYLQELYHEDPREYKAVLRVTPEQVDKLLNLIKMQIERQDTFMRDAIPAGVKLEVTLCFLSSGISYRLLAIFFRISKSSILKFIPEVCDVMYEALDEYLQVPDKREWEDIQVGFHHRWNFPGCCGAFDGKHVYLDVLAKPIQLQEESAIKMIRTTCVLHNWLRKSSLHTYTPPGSIDYEDILPHWC